MAENNAYVSVGLEAANCRFEIRVNDVPVSRNRYGNPLNTAIPVSQYLLRGTNTFTVRLWPKSGETTLASAAAHRITLLERPGQAPRAADQTVAGMAFISPDRGAWTVEQAVTPLNATPVPIDEHPSHWMTGDPVGGLALQHGFPRPFQLPQWSWENSDRIAGDFATRESLLQEYRTLWLNLQSQSTAHFPELFAERTRELARAFSMEEAEVPTVRRLQQVAADPDCRLRPLDGNPVLEVFGNGRLARIVRSNGQPLIHFAIQGTALLRSYDLMFRRQGQRWILTR